MQKQQPLTLLQLDGQELFDILPNNLKKLVKKPQFNEKKVFSDLSLKNIQRKVNYIKTKTLIQLSKDIIAKEKQKDAVDDSLNNQTKTTITVINKNVKDTQQINLPSNNNNNLLPPLISTSIKTIPFTTTPIILIFCQPSQQINIDPKKYNVYPFVPVSYCRWLQSAGAKCIPLPYNMNEGSIDYLLQRTHGILIPGGAANLYRSYDKKQGYGPVTIGFQKVWRKINKLWANGIHYPIWGTCLGLEMVLMAITKDVKVLSNLNSRKHQLEVYPDYQCSTIMSQCPTQLKVKIENEQSMNFNHMYGISVKRYLNYPKINEKLRITGITKDKDGTWFCSLLEGRTNPIFLSQFHPEKLGLQWSKKKGDIGIQHERYSTLLSQFMAKSFVRQASKCKNILEFKNSQQLSFHLFQNYKKIHIPSKMYKVYAIDYKYRQVDKQQWKQIKNQRRESYNNNIVGGVTNTNKSIKVPFV